MIANATRGKVFVLIFSMGVYPIISIGARTDSLRRISASKKESTQRKGIGSESIMRAISTKP